MRAVVSWCPSCSWSLATPLSDCVPSSVTTNLYACGCCLYSRVSPPQHGICGSNPKAQRPSLISLSSLSSINPVSPPMFQAHEITCSLTNDLLWKKVKMFITQSCPTLCDPMDCSPPGSSVHGILSARILEWVAIPFSRGSSQARDQTQVSCNASRFFTIWATREASMIPYASELSHFSWVRPLATPWTLVAKSCLTLCNSSAPGSFVHGIL